MAILQVNGRLKDRQSGRALKRDVLRDRHITDTIMDFADHRHHLVHAGCRRHPNLADRGAQKARPEDERRNVGERSLLPVLR
ncbi:hypothetical protein AVEN_25081-1 [Araneus ventricosus]|uniref:Uncharacterized protein n=1 Tax=Araneus ventricosus TaxID=182803 RepID=A0A4Y2K602_ARAVE|nr:hypothetical protein AVEN_25081-1 [Araneus ventricosus]